MSNLKFIIGQIAAVIINSVCKLPITMTKSYIMSHYWQVLRVLLNALLLNEKKPISNLLLINSLLLVFVYQLVVFALVCLLRLPQLLVTLVYLHVQLLVSLLFLTQRLPQ